MENIPTYLHMYMPTYKVPYFNICTHVWIYLHVCMNITTYNERAYNITTCQPTMLLPTYLQHKYVCLYNITPYQPTM